MAEHRDAMVNRWVDWLGDRLTGTRAVPREVVEEEFRLLIDIFTSMVGPLRRETKSVWSRAAECYGRHAAARGLAAGEVVEEMQYLRELLIRYLAPAIAALRPRQGMALLLRLNRLVDKGVAEAVVGYTDELVTSILPGEEPHSNSATSTDCEQTRAQLKELRAELERIVQR